MLPNNITINFYSSIVTAYSSSHLEGVMDDKQREAALVKAAYKRMKRQEDSLTQELLAEEFGVTQGLVGHWLNGISRIPDATLLLLSGRLGFDALEVRPSIRENYLLARKVLTNEDEVDQLRELLDQLTDEELDQVELMIEILVARRERVSGNS